MDKKIFSQILPSWNLFFDEEIKKDYFKNLISFLVKSNNFFPSKEDIFKIFKICDLNNIKVIILGQDPYHGGQADGIAFSSTQKIFPKSLLNIEKELFSDIGKKFRNGPNLTYLVEQGVFLINTKLTVEKHKPNSHSSIGWEEFIKNFLLFLKDKKKNIVYVLWGNNSKEFEKNIENEGNLILKSSHPSPLSAHRGFFGSKPFSKINSYLGSNQIQW